ncbi:MAG: YdcF family protein [Pseudomonadota bacterium]
MTAIVILGAAVGPRGPSPSLRRRTLHGAGLYHAGQGDIVVPCGGLGPYPPTEAEAMRDILRDEGVPITAIHCDDQSLSTYENLANAQKILVAHGKPDIILVTDSLHAPRARLTAWALGLKARADTPPLKPMPVKTRLRRFRHEAFAFPIYLVRLPFWLWRDRRP